MPNNNFYEFSYDKFSYFVTINLYNGFDKNILIF